MRAHVEIVPAQLRDLHLPRAVRGLCPQVEDAVHCILNECVVPRTAFLCHENGQETPFAGFLEEC